MMIWLVKIGFLFIFGLLIWSVISIGWCDDLVDNDDSIGDFMNVHEWWKNTELIVDLMNRNDLAKWLND